MRPFWLGAVLVWLACGPTTGGDGKDAAVAFDAGEVDAGVVDGGAIASDAGTEPTDGGPSDGGADAGLNELDAGIDAGNPHAGSADASVDAGTSDGGFEDAGRLDASVADAGDADAGFDGGPSFRDGGVRVRIVAANLTSGNNQSYDPGHGQRILRALQADIVAIQEFNFGNRTPTEIASFVSSTFDGGFFFVRGSGGIPNGVISRYPILDAGEWDDARAVDREFTWALLDVPGPAPMLVVSVHLLGNSAGNRNLEATQLVNYLDAHAPPNAWVVVAGDFNTDGRGETALSTFESRFVVQGPWPSDGTLADGGNSGTSFNRSRPYDWVLASPSLHAVETPVSLGGRAFERGLVFDTRVFTPLPPPALIGDSAAANMQHMAVVRDFWLP